MSVKSGFTSTFGVVIALLVVGLAVPVLFCGGCLLFRDWSASRNADQQARKEADRVLQEQDERLKAAPSRTLQP